MEEYINSRNLTYLITDSFKLIDRRLMDHGLKTAYIFCRMLELTGKYEKFEIADFAILGMLHDIGAYKTDNLNDMLKFEAKEYLPHSIYGYLFMKYLSPLEEQSKIILYHNTDYNKMERVEYIYKEEAFLLNLAEKVAIYYNALGSSYDPNMFDKFSGRKFSPDALALYKRAIEEFDILHKLSSDVYREEMDEIIDYVIFSDEEKDKYLAMLMYCTGFRSESSVVDTVTTICVCKELGSYMKCTPEELQKLHYGALVHDIGMLAIPRSIIEAARKLTPEEYARMQTHVEIAENLLGDRMIPEIVETATAHHERSDGSGYNKGKKEHEMNLLQAILQVGDTITGLVNKRSYRPAFPKEKVISILLEETAKGKYRKDVVDVFVLYYDDIMSVVSRESQEILKTHSKLREQYEQVYRNLKPGG